MAAPIPIAQAFALILEHAGSAPVEAVPLTAALGHVLAQDIKADRDWPPFNRSAVDGYAVFSNDTRSAPDVLEVIEEVPAGKAPTRVVSPGQAVKIMTGAPVPAGADAVIMVEQTSIPRPGFVKFQQTITGGQNISQRGEDKRADDVVLQAGMPIGAGEVGVLAAAGCAQVPVRRKPKFAILGTGDELVEPGQTPSLAQIRNSNSYQLLAQCQAHHFEATYLGIARDTREDTRRLIETGLQSDVLLSTGGVSVGEHDHVGATLKELGVEIVFNKVAVKPGKPTTFGKRGGTLVFGLPGNPVAAYVCFHLFVLTAIRQRMGAAEPLPNWISLPLIGNAKNSGDRTTFRPARLVVKEGQTFVEVLEWHGSGHLAALAGATGLCVQPPNTALSNGEMVTFYPF